MKNVFIVFEHITWEGNFFQAVFSSKKLAEQYIERVYDRDYHSDSNFYITEAEIDKK